MIVEKSSAEISSRRLFLASLATASFASSPITVLAALLLVDIGKTFNTAVETTGQINTTYSIAAFILALSTGALSVRFRHKSVLLTGLVLMSVSALGCFTASDFVTLLVFYSLSGAGYAMVNPMTFAMVGEHFPLEKRANAIGWIVAGGASAYVIGAPIIALMSGPQGWRFPLLVFVIPVLLVTFFLAFFGLPSASIERRIRAQGKNYIRSFKEVLLNRSAVACLIGDTLRSAAFVAIVLYATSFFRQRFSLPTDIASLILLGGAMSYVFGSLATGSFVNRFGRKNSTVITALLSGMFTIVYALIPSLWLSIVLMLTASWFFGMVASSANSLTLEQVPSLRGTMMSIDTAVINIGSALGTVSGGLALFLLDYEGLGSVLGTTGIVAALIFYLLAKDPTKSP
jgi:DHA1 family inner membrane transport protein